MDEVEVSRWTLAGELLEQVLDLPPGQQTEAISHLGDLNQVRDELMALVTGARGESALDSSLEKVLEEMPASLPAHSALKGRTFDRWTLGEEIGRGGMSVVYHATHEGDGFEQHAALKILSIAFLSDEHVASFLRERQILSDLNHPGIARLIDGGVTPDGGPFLVMEFVDGERIDRWCKERQPGLKATGRLMLKLCRAVAYAQRHLVVHRDINPANVMIDQHDQPILIDFGIAKLLGEAPRGQTLKAFTPEFAAPEQRCGDAITTGTDVFGLGKLFRHLTRSLKLDHDLNLILNVATHEDPEQRYANARNLADDLQAWLGQRPVVARPDSVFYRGRKFARRHWQWLTAVVVVIVVGLVGVLSTQQQAEISRQEALKHRAVADFMLNVFQQADLMRTGADLRVTDLLETAADQAQHELGNNPETLVSLLTLIASGQLELTNYDEAERLLNAARALMEQHLVAPRTEADYLLQRGKQSYEQGDYTDAVEKVSLAMEIFEGDPLLMEAYFESGASLVSYLVDAEAYDRARTLSDQLMEAVTEGPASPGARAMITHRHAVALEVTGEYGSALDHYRSALELQQADQPRNLLGRAAILSDYGIALYFAGRYDSAEVINREALEIYQSNFEMPHPRISSAMHNVAFSLVGQEQYNEAAEILTQTLAMSVELQGPEHIESLLEAATLGTVVARTGDYPRAEHMFRQNLEALERIAPEMTVQRGAVHSYLADVLLQTERLAESRIQYLAALELFRELPADHVRVVEVNERLAEIAEKMESPQATGVAIP